MKLSELIKILQEKQNKFGDCDVSGFYGEKITDVCSVGYDSLLTGKNSTRIEIILEHNYTGK